MKRTQIVFLAVVACAAMAVNADSDIQSKVTRWASAQQDWLNAEAVDFSQWVDAVIANPDVNEDMKALFVSFRQWAGSVIAELDKKFAAIKLRPANPSSEELQQLKEDIRDIQGKITSTLEIVNERSDEVYAHIKENKANPTSQGNEEALVSIDAALRKRVKNDEVWRTRASGEGHNIASEIPGEE